MILDCHVHINDEIVNKDELCQRMNSAGINGGIIISLSPDSFHTLGAQKYTAYDRLNNLLNWTDANPNLYPFFWIDPLEEDAIEQVQEACRRGVSGFKVICNHFYPSDKKALEVYKTISRNKKPILFHSGILWDGKPSSKYNRPAEFEELLEIEGLRFALAHVSWPWYDENIAVYGKFLDAHRRRSELSVEMFIDITPGTPPIYRKEVLKKLYTLGYDVENNVIFGTDCVTHDYNFSYAQEWIERDNAIYEELKLDSDIKEKIYYRNLKRFLGI